MGGAHRRGIATLIILGVVTAAAGTGACGSSTSTPGNSDGGGDGGNGGADAAQADAAATTVVAATYSQTCSRDADCVAVVEGDVCFLCNSCYTTAAIAATDQTRYQADVDAKKNLCTNGPVACGGDCPQRRAICESGKCVHDDCSGGCIPRDAGTD